MEAGSGLELGLGPDLGAHILAYPLNIVPGPRPLTGSRGKRKEIGKSCWKKRRRKRKRKMKGAVEWAGCERGVGPGQAPLGKLSFGSYHEAFTSTELSSRRNGFLGVVPGHFHGTFVTA